MDVSRLAALQQPIRVGIIGAGVMGRAVAHQCALTPGVACVAVADIVVDRALSVAGGGGPARLVETPGAMADAICSGEAVATEDGRIVAGCPAVDVVVECSSSILEGAQFVELALQAGKHVVLVNSEIDLAFGPYFADLAGENGVVSTSMDGDQHGVLKRLADEVRLWGFDLVMAGNIKGFLNQDANPENIVPEADKRNLDYRMCTAYTDGTKLNIEMALVANSLGLKTDVPGMHGPRCERVEQAPAQFDLETMWDGETGVVDYILGAEPGGGVFVIGHCGDPYQREMMAYYKLGDGPFYLFHRPYHLCHVEAVRTVAEAFLDGETLMQPTAGFRTEVYARAKQELRAGEVLDGIGGFACHGEIENCSADWREAGLPICLSEGLRLRRDVRKGESIALADVEADLGAPTFRLYAEGQKCAGRLP